MAEFTLPELGENVEKGDVTRIMVAVGDTIKVDQPVVELETDKATIEVPSSIAGVVKELRVKTGDKVKVGQVILVADEAAAGADAKAPAAKPAEPAAGAKGAKAEAPAPKPAVVEAKVTAAQDEPPARHEVIDINTARPAASAAPRPSEVRSAPVQAPPGTLVPAAPSVRRFARELGVEIGEVGGTGPGGRIGQEDVKDHVRDTLSGSGGGGRAARTGPLPDFSRFGEIESRPMSNIRRKTAEHLTAAWQAPHVTQHDRADVTALEEFRKAYGGKVEKAGGKLTVTAILLKICAQAIAKYPQFASSVDMANDAIVYKKYTHIGVAVDTPNGLLVPVIRDADKKTVTAMAAELATLSQKARDKKLSLDEMSGGVFSITNLGGIGGTSFTPIVNRPEVAILGVSRTTIEPVFNPSTSLGTGPSTSLGAAAGFVPRQMLPLSLSYDHRAIDGADAARFLRFIAEALEQPLSMYL
jgi:pyruvate dehydrogenase E2 component (dihydrolipoamide acetyltransferase)